MSVEKRSKERKSIAKNLTCQLISYTQRIENHAFLL